VPAVVLSAVMVECYKKYILVSLLHHGVVKPAPKYTSSIVQRNLKGLCPQYQDFATAYGSNNTDELHKVATQHAEVFTKVCCWLSRGERVFWPSDNTPLLSCRTTTSVW
jgi:hypothetical protein